jgi:hypothetical protein
MVDASIDDGVRIAQLLASELVGHGGRLASVTVTDADPDVTATADGRRAYAIRADGDPLATAFVHPGRVRLEFVTAHERVREAGVDAGLTVRSSGDGSPRTVVVVADGAEVKRALAVFEAAVAAPAGDE